MAGLTPSASGEYESYWRRHAGALFLGGFGLLLLVIIVGQLLDRGDVEAWLAEQSAEAAYLIVFLLVGLDAVIPIFPGETTLNAASTIAADGGLELGLVMVAGALGAIVGDSCLFWIARKNAAKVRPSLDKATKNQKVEAAWSMLDASPGLLIVGGRYVPGMRFAVNASMGLSDIPYRRFLPWSVLGGALWSIYTCGLAYLVASTLAGFPFASMVIAAVITSCVLVATYFVYRRRQRRVAEQASGDTAPPAGSSR